MASTFVKYDFLNHKKDGEHSVEIVKILKEKGLNIDGCVTFWEDCGPLAAKISDLLHLNGPGQHAAEIAKKKSWTHAILRTKTGDIPHFPRTYLYAAKCYHIKGESDIYNAVNYIGIPTVLKLEYGSSAVGVKPIKDHTECTNIYQDIKTKLRSEKDHPGIGLGHSNDLLLMEYIEGTEHAVDIIIFQRQLIEAFVSDNGPTHQGRFTETTALMPSCLLPDREGQLVTAAYQCCTEIGLVDGVFNVDMKMTKTGPKLIEINARMGGFYLRDWILTCYGIDLLLYSFMCCLGIRPIIARQTPRCHLMGTMCVPSAHKEQLKDSHKLNSLNTMIQKGIVQYNQIEASLDDCGSEDEEEPFCSIAVTASNRTHAKQKLLNVGSILALNTKDYDLNYFLKDFEE
jgi:carnosine synthase